MPKTESLLQTLPILRTWAAKRRQAALEDFREAFLQRLIWALDPQCKAVFDRMADGAAAVAQRCAGSVKTKLDSKNHEAHIRLLVPDRRLLTPEEEAFVAELSDAAAWCLPLSYPMAESLHLHARFLCYRRAPVGDRDPDVLLALARELRDTRRLSLTDGELRQEIEGILAEQKQQEARKKTQ